MMRKIFEIYEKIELWYWNRIFKHILKILNKQYEIYNMEIENIWIDKWFPFKERAIDSDNMYYDYDRIPKILIKFVNETLEEDKFAISEFIKQNISKYWNVQYYTNDSLKNFDEVEQKWWTNHNGMLKIV